MRNIAVIGFGFAEKAGVVSGLYERIFADVSSKTTSCRLDQREDLDPGPLSLPPGLCPGTSATSPRRARPRAQGCSQLPRRPRCPRRQAPWPVRDKTGIPAFEPLVWDLMALEPHAFRAASTLSATTARATVVAPRANARQRSGLTCPRQSATTAARARAVALRRVALSPCRIRDQRRRRCKDWSPA